MFTAGILAVALLDRGLVLVAAYEAPPQLQRETLTLLVVVGVLVALAAMPPGVTRRRRWVVLGGLWFSSLLLAVSQHGIGHFGVVLIVALLVIAASRVGLPIAAFLVVLWIAAWIALLSFRPIWGSVPEPSLLVFGRDIWYVVAILLVLLIQHARAITQVSELSEIRTSLKAAVDELSAANMSYNTFVQMAESQAARHERSRITREIHDGVGYALTNLLMLAESAQDLMTRDPAGVSDLLTTIRNQARLALADTRRALRELREVEQALVYGEPALGHMMDVFEQATGVRTVREFLLPEAALKNPRVFPVVYRFVQEALTNSFRHGHAGQVWLRVWLIDGELIVSVTDNGDTPGEISEGIGLQGMRERLGEIGGELSYHSIDGFTVIARLPYTPKEATYA